MILVLPGTKWSEGLCKRIKERGEELLLISPEERPYCKKYADVFFRSDIFAVDAIENFCKDKQVKAVISDECDIAMPVVAELGKRLGVKTLSKNMAALFTNKFLMREFSKKYGFNYPEYKLCRSIEEAKVFLIENEKSIIIKPIDGNASHGVFRINTLSELESHFDESVAFSRTEKAVLAERYVEGKEFTVDGIKTPNRHYTLAISEKKHFAHNRNIAYELFFTHYNNNYDYDKLRKVNDLFVDKSGLEYGFTHAEYKYEDGDFYLIEIAARGGGNQISSIITQFMSGYETYDFLIESALGVSEEKDFRIRDSFRNRASVLHFFHVPNGGGKVLNIIGEDYLKNTPEVLDYGLNFKIGDEIHDATNDSVRIGYYIAGAETKESLEELMQDVNKYFNIIVEQPKV